MSFGRCVSPRGSEVRPRVCRPRRGNVGSSLPWLLLSRPRSLVARTCVCVVRCWVPALWYSPTLLLIRPPLRPCPCPFRTGAPPQCPPLWLRPSWPESYVRFSLPLPSISRFFAPPPGVLPPLVCFPSIGASCPSFSPVLYSCRSDIGWSCSSSVSRPW